MQQIIDLFFKYLPTLIEAYQSVPKILQYVNETKATLQTTDEWTDEEEAKFNEEVERITSQEHWKIKD